MNSNQFFDQYHILAISYRNRVRIECVNSRVISPNNHKAHHWSFFICWVLWLFKKIDFQNHFT